MVSWSSKFTWNNNGVVDRCHCRSVGVRVEVSLGFFFTPMRIQDSWRFHMSLLWLLWLLWLLLLLLFCLFWIFITDSYCMIPSTLSMSCSITFCMSSRSSFRARHIHSPSTWSWLKHFSLKKARICSCIASQSSFCAIKSTMFHPPIYGLRNGNLPGLGGQDQASILTVQVHMLVGSRLLLRNPQEQLPCKGSKWGMFGVPLC